MTTKIKVTTQQIRENVKGDLFKWCTLALDPAGQQPARHHRLIIDALTEFANGDCDRLMINLPPGSAKSTFATVLFPCWWMANHPRGNIIVCSHAASLAETFSRQSRSYINDNAPYLGVSIPVGSSSVKSWALTNKSTFKCVGVGGSITGQRADILIIDDPVAGRDDADSPDRRNTLERWYKSDAYTRLKKGGKVLIICTRWHEDDLAGRLLQQQPDEWRVISLPAICDDPTNDILNRELGEPLWAEWQNAESLERIRRNIGERNWSALYQQRPVPLEGSLFQIHKLRKEMVEPSCTNSMVVRAWDLAASDRSRTKNPDYTCGVLMARTKDGRYMILDVVRIQGEPWEVEQLILNTAERDGKGVRISIPIDPGSAGKSYAEYITRSLAGYDVETSRETGSKVGRATPFCAQVNGGNVTMKNAIWNNDYIDELGVFPGGLRDDQVDASSRAFNFLVAKNQRPVEFAYVNRFRG